VTLTEAELAPILDAPRRPAKVVFVGYMRRYARPYLELKRRRPRVRQSATSASAT
jgi:myo-inositol 2-dehydrogenase / D-chiro-inositol 1-dehydrogenase